MPTALIRVRDDGLNQGDGEKGPDLVTEMTGLADWM